MASSATELNVQVAVSDVCANPALELRAVARHHDISVWQLRRRLLGVPARGNRRNGHELLSKEQNLALRRFLDGLVHAGVPSSLPRIRQIAGILRERAGVSNPLPGPDWAGPVGPSVGEPRRISPPGHGDLPWAGKPPPRR